MRNKKKIMVVDDSSTSTFLMESFLEENGYEVIIVEDSVKTLKKLKKEKPDVIFLDLMMPKKSGFEVLTEIKNNEETNKIPVIIVSAKTEKEDIQKAKTMGAAEYLSKPIDIEHILNLLHKYKI